VYVVLDQYTGELLYDGTPEEGNVFDQAWDDWNFPVHAGDFGSLTTRILWSVLGVATVALGVTGIVMNLIRQRKRARRARPTDRAAAPATAPADEPDGETTPVGVR
jgi:uncharacterized iron-regulated membrane protein